MLPAMREEQMTRRHGKGRLIFGPLLVATALGAADAVLYGVAPYAQEPQVLHWERNGRPVTGRAVGLLYTPDVLTALASRMPAGAVPTEIAKAIQQRTPIVVMWEIPTGRDYQHQRPYHIAIVEQDRPEAGAEGSIQPLWVQQEAGDLARVDGRLNSADMRVGAIAAFPAWAFVPGRLVVIHSTPEVRENGRRYSSQAWGVIRWHGTATNGPRAW
jgi:hypothetical protein